jgi:uncharacterized membrane protein YbhN (UPF0104 family)
MLPHGRTSRVGEDRTPAVGRPGKPLLPSSWAPTHPPLHNDATHTPAARRRFRPPRALGAALLMLAVVGVAAVALSRLDLPAAGAALAGADPEMLAAAVALYALGQTVSGVMWAICQGAGGVRISLGTVLGMHWISRAACEMLPASLGEAARVGIVRRHPAGRAAGSWRIVGGLAGYKVIDAAVTGLGVLAIAMAVSLPGPAAGLRWSAVGTVVVRAVAGVAWRMGAGRRMAALLPRRARTAAKGLGEGAAVLGDGPTARTAAVLGAGALVCRMLSLAALLLAFGAPPQAAALAFSVIVLAGVLPATPGGAGTREMILVPAMVMAYGIATPTALAFSVAVQAVSLTASLALGAAALAWLGPRLLRGAGDGAGPLTEPVAPLLLEVPAERSS